MLGSLARLRVIVTSVDPMSPVYGMNAVANSRG